MIPLPLPLKTALGRWPNGQRPFSIVFPQRSLFQKKYSILKTTKLPACVEACLTRRLDFGDVDELKAKYGADLVSELPCTPKASMTNANLLIKATDAALAEDYVERFF